eukprot:s1072_g16.t1
MGATLQEMRAYILLRNSGLAAEDKKRIIVDAQGELDYEKVTSALQLLGSKFFGEVQQGSSKGQVRTKTYDANMVDEQENEIEEADESIFVASEMTEESVFDVLMAEGDEDALIIQQFEEAIVDSLQGDPEANSNPSVPASGASTAFAGISVASADGHHDPDDLLTELPLNAVAFTVEEAGSEAVEQVMAMTLPELQE